jgi:RimJ/RimL family protein N-acetyltransferase
VTHRPPVLHALVWPRHTPRLVLRPVTLGDVDAILAYRSLTEVGEFTSRGPMSRAEVEERVELLRESATAGAPQPRLGLVVEHDGAVVGDCSVRLESDDNGMWRASVAYAIGPGEQGRGYATEVVRDLLVICFGHLHLALVEADVFVPHVASQRVLEKAGLRRVAHTPAGSEGGGRPRLDDFVYAVTAAEWAAHHR